MQYRIDKKRIFDGNVQIQGWVLPKDIEKTVMFNVVDTNNNKIDYDYVKVRRDDVSQIFLHEIKENNDWGFIIEFPYEDEKNDVFYLIIDDTSERIKLKIDKESIDKFNTVGRKRKEILLSYLNVATFKRAFEFLFKEGPINFLKKAIRKYNGINVDYDYSEWYELTKPTDSELEFQRTLKMQYCPSFSIVIPIYDTKDEFLQSLFNSILNQTYKNFEVCIADATDYKVCKNNPKSFFEKLIANNKGLEQVIKIKYLNENKSIADNTNEAIKMASGDYIVLCDHDDALTYDALYEVAKLINEDKEVLFIYSDEDKVDMKDESYFEPAFKPDFNLDMLLSVNYFCHLSVIKKSLLDELYEKDGVYERAEYNGAQDYDLFLRLTNLIINKSYKNGKYDITAIKHIPKVLYHWRCHKDSTSSKTDSKLYAFENGNRAIEDFYKNTKINFKNVECVKKGFDYGLYHTVYKKEINEPLISVIIPNKDHIDDLKLTIDSVKKGSYKNLEFIICENNSKKAQTFEFYDDLIKDKSIKVIEYKGEFNYSKINNYAKTFASGEYLLFLNNDVEMISDDSIHEMYSYVVRDDVGAVGSKLLYKDNTYQHAGVIVGIGGVADHMFKNINDFDHTYMNRAQICQDLNAVTAACLMIKKSVFDKICGFDEKLQVAFNDIDLCLKVRKEGYLIVYNPYSSFYHYESKSRGYEDTPEKIKRFNKEFAYFAKKWRDKLDTIDEYYNPNLTLRQNNFALRNLKYEKIGDKFPLRNDIKELMEQI